MLVLIYIILYIFFNQHNLLKFVKKIVDGVKKRTTPSKNRNSKIIDKLDLQIQPTTINKPNTYFVSSYIYSLIYIRNNIYFLNQHNLLNFVKKISFKSVLSDNTSDNRLISNKKEIIVRKKDNWKPYMLNGGINL